MLTVYLDNGDHGKLRVMEVCPPISGKQLTETLVNTHRVNSDKYFFKNNGRLIELDDFVYNGDISLEQKLCGGKGGFGSMLRAIGAQIEKTTNREACRDLSGRRLRDINEEKRLKAWLEKQTKREEEAAERKKKKLEKLCAEPKHEFKDKTYEQQRSALTERVEDAVEVGFAAASTSAVKRAADESAKTNLKKKKKTILDLDEEIDSDDLTSSDESGDEKEAKKMETASHSKSNMENTSSAPLNCPGISNEVKEEAAKEETRINNTDTKNSSDDTSNCTESSNDEKEFKSANNSSKQIDDASR